MTTVNQYHQPVGEALPNWTPRPFPPHTVLEGRHCRLEPFAVEKHAQSLFAAYSMAEDGRDWTYMAFGPFNDLASYVQHAQVMQASRDPLHFAVIDKATERAVGTVALMRIEQQHGVMEVGHVTFSPLLKQTRMSTEAHYLLMTLAFERLGYRRYEWKCDNCNTPSRNAALRLGFQFEGIFRQAIVYNGRTRDTAWFSIIDGEWPVVKQALERWLSDDNFDGDGRQIQPLQALRG